ncbi:MAG: helix-turn-helix transcriptional regulator [Eubacteriales bacterium]|nr:helix-turn-helix transcriptional regulator [Eubacteriales bacterium]
MIDLMDHKQSAIDAEIRNKGHYRHTIISFQTLFQNEPFYGRPDSLIARTVGLPTLTIKTMRKNMPVSTEAVQKICAYLHCQPGDFMVALDTEYIPARNEKTPAR